MRSTPIGIAMLNDERKHVWEKNNPLNMEVVNRWADVIREGLGNVDGSSPEVVVAPKIITSVRVAQEIGEELARRGCKQIIMCYNVWNFPFLAWPFINCFGADTPVLLGKTGEGRIPPIWERSARVCCQPRSRGFAYTVAHTSCTTLSLQGGVQTEVLL